MKKEKNKSLAASLIESFSLIFNMYKDAIEKIPENQWKTGEIEYLVPARLILHAIKVIDYYSTDNPTSYLWEKRFDNKLAVGDIPNEDLPSKQTMMEYHYAVKIKFEDWLKNLDIDELFKPEEKFPWTGSTLLSRIMYIIGHHRQHFGEINAELRRRDLPRIKWRTLRS